MSRYSDSTEEWFFYATTTFLYFRHWSIYLHSKVAFQLGYFSLISPFYISFYTWLPAEYPWILIWSWHCDTLSPHIFLLLCFFFFFGPHLQHVGVPGLEIKSNLWRQLQAYATARTTPDPSHIWDLWHGLQQYQIFNPLSKARDRIRILTDTMSGS